MVLLGLATTAWPSAARAATTPSFTLVRQDPVAPLGAAGTARLDLALRLTTPDRRAVVRLSLYPRLVTRAALAPVLNGSAPGTRAVSTTGNLTITCNPRRTVSLRVTLFTGAPAGGRGPCATRPARLRLPCRGAACDGVYPLSYSVTSGGVATTQWSLVALRASHVASPLRVDLVYGLDPSALAHPARTRAVLSALARHPAVPVAITADYRTLEALSREGSASAALWHDALSGALASALHRGVVAPPGDVDYAALAAGGLRGQVDLQLTLASTLLRDLTGRFVDAPVVVSGHPTAAALAALGAAGAREIVLPEASLATPPSTTLTWGAPFRVVGAPGVLALASDEGIANLAGNSAIEPARRAVLFLDALAFLHFQEPNAPAVRTVVVVSPAASLDPAFVDDVLAGLAGDPFATASSLVPSFDSALVSSNGAPATRAMAPGPPSTWSAANRTALRSLAARLTSFAAAIPNQATATALRVSLARTEVLGPPGPRQAALTRLAADLSDQLGRFSIDAGSVTLAGPGTPLPVTIYSRERYTVRVVVHLITDRITFPTGASVPVALDAPVKSLRVATANHRGSDLILQVVVTTPDGRVTLAHAAIQVRIAGTSVVGYLLTGASLLVIGLWWWRTARRPAKGRHAR